PGTLLGRPHCGTAGWSCNGAYARVPGPKGAFAASCSSAGPGELLEPAGPDRAERLRACGESGDEIIGRRLCQPDYLDRVAVAHLVFGELVLVKDTDGTVTQLHHIKVKIDRGHHISLDARLRRHIDVDRDVGLARAVPACDPASVGRDEDDKVVRLQDRSLQAAPEQDARPAAEPQPVPVAAQRL